LPVLVLTVDITAESKRRALAAGAKDFLAKPLDAVEVLLRVRNLLETRFLYLQLQQRADERIREQAALIDQANDAILVCDLADRVTFWNRGAETLYGWTAADILAHGTLATLFPPASDLGPMQAALAANGTWSGELPQVARDGRELVVASRWTLLHGPDGKPKSKLIINTDITETKKTEEKLLRAQRLENIGRLAGGIAHDLNNILTPLTVSVDVLAMNPTDPAHKELLATIQASLARGVNLLRQILTFARGVGGQRRALLLGSLINELASFFRQTFPRTIQIETAVADNLWPIVADSTQLHQVLTNLCVNARDAMPEGGRLRITAVNYRLEEPQARDEGLTPGPFVVVEVEDTGTGIPAAIVPKIYETFFTTKEAGKGTGLGLSIAQGIVHNHGGRMRVATEVGKGSRFTMLLPARETVMSEAPEPERKEIVGGKGEWVLVLDDETALLHIAKLTLAAAGYQVLTAQDSVEALALYSQRVSDIQVVVTDLLMPLADGTATIEALRRVNPAVRIIVCSASATGQETAQAMRAAAFLPKPYTVEGLLSTVRSVLDS
jgi:PAS domain S-box-containing protein